MKKTLLLALTVVALGVSTSAMAQTAGPAGLPPQSPIASRAGGKHMTPAERRQMNEEILAKLNLSPDQVAKIKAHDADMETKLAALKQQAKADRKAGKSSDAREQVQALEKENRAFMKETLTKPQLRQYAMMRREAMKAYEAKNGVATPTAKP